MNYETFFIGIFSTCFSIVGLLVITFFIYSQILKFLYNRRLKADKQRETDINELKLLESGPITALDSSNKVKLQIIKTQNDPQIQLPSSTGNDDNNNNRKTQFAIASKDVYIQVNGSDHSVNNEDAL
ncbi:hypothetical protein GJ496_001034 [Pomphorhynchus laevis]|nr:hypothetical protein GJ496_001034 [Pomphorhynchus laevis]